jgi:hypothetical protein
VGWEGLREREKPSKKCREIERFMDGLIDG